MRELALTFIINAAKHDAASECCCCSLADMKLESSGTTYVLLYKLSHPPLLCTVMNAVQSQSRYAVKYYSVCVCISAKERAIAIANSSSRSDFEDIASGNSWLKKHKGRMERMWLDEREGWAYIGPFECYVEITKRDYSAIPLGIIYRAPQCTRRGPPRAG